MSKSLPFTPSGHPLRPPPNGRNSNRSPESWISLVRFLLSFEMMRGMSYAIRSCRFSTFTGSNNKFNDGSFGSNNSNKPISVLDTRRSLTPSTSTLSSSFGSGGNGITTTAGHH
ncbi:unnamed protein product [Lactuca saligna]|uniref:Uncharacterized protein n=1 Tax=Lactuca saligna TaxID=75948 RepID=A0AA35VLM1_LACSI|nr:unnamed protein product [Lactuca saligna]